MTSLEPMAVLRTRTEQTRDWFTSSRTELLVSRFWRLVVSAIVARRVRGEEAAETVAVRDSGAGEQHSEEGVVLQEGLAAPEAMVEMSESSLANSLTLRTSISVRESTAMAVAAAMAVVAVTVAWALAERRRQQPLGHRALLDHLAVKVNPESWSVKQGLKS